MAKIHGAPLIVNGDQVVLQTLSIIGPMCPLSQIQAFQREIDPSRDLAGVAAQLRVVESLEMNCNDVWGFPQIELFHSLDMNLAVWAIPTFISGQDFRFTV